jgi:pyruvate kinase
VPAASANPAVAGETNAEVCVVQEPGSTAVGAIHWPCTSRGIASQMNISNTAIAKIFSIRLYYSAFLLLQATHKNLMATTRKTKIVATIGPGSESKENFTKLLHAGVDIARTNMSHDDQTIHEARIHNIRAAAAEAGMPIEVLVDLSGPKIRIGDFANGSVELIPGAQFILSTTPCEGTVEKVFFNFPEIAAEMKAGQVIMIDDGRRKLVVNKVEDGDIYTTVAVGGTIKGRRGVNLPNAFLTISALTEKDKSDLEFGVKAGADYIALSFVRTAKDIEELRALITQHGGSQPIIAKIETPEAVERIDEIIAATDGIMVARGDLAVEIGHAKVPAVQKMLIKKCNAAGKPVIVATQMLESMIKAPVPTRAEVSDIAHAVYDHADATMLSEESSLGEFAVEAVSMMQEVIVETEKDMGASLTAPVVWKK